MYRMLRERVAELFSKVLICCASGLLAVQANAGDARKISVDDVMQVGGYGDAAMDPSGRWLVFERIRPYDQLTDYSFRTYAGIKSGHQLWRYDLEREGGPEPVPGIDLEPHSYQLGFSPSGRFLLVMQYKFGKLTLGAYDVARERLVQFDGVPAFNREGHHNPVWISRDELMFAAMPDGEWPAETSVRAYAGSVLAGAWQDAWRGGVVTAREARTIGVDESAQQEAGSLVRANAMTGRTQVVSEGLHADLRVSPDRRWLAALAVSGSRGFDPAKPAEPGMRRHGLVLVDLETYQLRRLADDLEFFPYTISWAADSRRLAVFGWKVGESPRQGGFHVVDANTGQVTRYEHVGLDLASERERGWMQRPERTAFLGDALAIFARPVRGDDLTPRFSLQDIRPSGVAEANWYSLLADGSSKNLTGELSGVSPVPVHAAEDHFTIWAEDGVYRLYANGQRRRLSPAMTGRFNFVAAGNFATRGSVVRPEFADEARFTVTHGQTVSVVMLDLREGRRSTMVIQPHFAQVSPLAGSIVAGRLLLRIEDGPSSRLFMVDRDTPGTYEELGSVNAHLAGLDVGTWRVIAYPFVDSESSQSGTTLESCILLPPSYDAKRPPPLIVEVYPDAGARCKTHPPTVSAPYPTSPYLWAGQGYAYARITTPRELIRTKEGPIAGMDELVDAGISALVKKGWVDPKRIALYGFSQGGISALYVAAHTRWIKAVIAMNGWADMFSHYFGSAGIYSHTYGGYFGSFGRYDNARGSDFSIGQTPFDNPEIYYRNSPVFLAPQIQAPVMLIHSDMDSFSMSQFDQMYGALLRSGKDARYVRYLGEGHGPSSPANIRDMWDRQLKFLAEQGVAP